MDASGLESLLPDEDDLLYEEELLRNPYSVRMWWRYLQARKDAPLKKRYLIFERALKALPGSYKLWHAYLTERRLAVRGLAGDNPAVGSLNNTYERALVSMHKMPRIWVEYLEHLSGQCRITQMRHAFDKAIAALPITQHDRLWGIYLTFIQQPGMPVDTAQRVYRRYLQLEPSHAEEYVEFLKSKGKWGEAARKLADIVNDDTFRSLAGKTKHALWLELCDIVTKHPAEVKDAVRVEPIIRGGIRRFTDEVGRLWNALADYHIRRGHFEKARDIYEEGMTSVMRVRDFSLIYDALTQFEESLLSARMEEAGDDDPGASAATAPADDGADFLLRDDGDDLDLRLARLEHLLDRRPELLSSCRLRQNPHDVTEWHKRVALFEGQPLRQIQTYTEALKTVDPHKATGKAYGLWCAFAKFYERHQQLDSARFVFEKAVVADYVYTEDVATVWREWAEMELRNKNYKSALSVLRRATTPPASITARTTRAEEKAMPVHARVYRQLKLWELYVDLEESLGTLESTKAVYERIIKLRICTPQIILNYASMLEEANYFEESFKAYEKGLAIFKYPHAADLWQTYLAKFVARYKGAKDKIERTRDMFEQAVKAAPKAAVKPIFLQFAKWEEEFGRTAKAMAIYERAAGVVPRSERLSVYLLYLDRASTYYGVAKVREIYELAIEAQAPRELGDGDLLALCLRYAELERGLGEIDRARAIFVHASAVADSAFWKAWEAFEVPHGNEETYREMLRIKRAVQSTQSMTQHVGMAAVSAANGAGEGGDDDDGGGGTSKRGRDEMEALEAAAEAAAGGGGTAVGGFVSAGVVNSEAPKEGTQAAGGLQVAADPAEIDLGEEEAAPAAEAAPSTSGAGDGPVADGGRGVEEREVPAGVFGASGLSEEPAEPEPPMGALERLKKRRKQ